MNNINAEELQLLIQRILNSGVLGRSKTYSAILNYLVECSIEGQAPKEIAIAIDVLGREADFDVAKDSIVRVHLYHLRNKLKSYYEKYGQDEKFQMSIPKGQYMLAITPIVEISKGEQAISSTSKKVSPYMAGLIGLVIILLALNVFQQLGTKNVRVVNPYAAHGLWQTMLDDETPVMIVIGDYYIFGELDENGNIARMIREFEINSSEDLVFEQDRTERFEQYFNLDLSYIPTSSAFALAQIMPVFAEDSDRVTVKMMSELSTADLVANHIIYLGYLSGLGSLIDLMFASSGLSIGGTYDELINLETNEYYSSSSGLSIGENSFQDYGMVTTFPSLTGNQFVIIAGMRDEGLINLSEEITTIDELVNLEKGLGITGGAEVERSYEALYEVIGFDNTNFDADLVYSGSLSTEIIWEARLINNE